MPFNTITEWIENEKQLGSRNPDRMVLATADKNAIPHSRIVAIREINNKSLLFFTQLWTRKAQEIKKNPVASATIWLPLQQREIIVDGAIETLNTSENEYYWKSLPRLNQLRFSTYAPTSGQPIDSINILNDKLKMLDQQYQNTEIPMKDFYCGYRLVPRTIYFYTLGVETFSEYIRYELNKGLWQQQLLSP
jgi:pyridoxamine 5'-phosphate oxidase